MPGRLISTAAVGVSTALQDILLVLIILPVNLVSITDKGEHFVYLVDQTSNTAKRQLIEVGNLYNEGIAITNGLKAGDQVISSGYHKLTNNTPITLRTK